MEQKIRHEFDQTKLVKKIMNAQDLSFNYHVVIEDDVKELVNEALNEEFNDYDSVLNRVISQIEGKWELIAQDWSFTFAAQLRSSKP